MNNYRLRLAGFIGAMISFGAVALESLYDGNNLALFVATVGIVLSLCSVIEVREHDTHIHVLREHVELANRRADHAMAEARRLRNSGVQR